MDFAMGTNMIMKSRRFDQNYTRKHGVPWQQHTKQAKSYLNLKQTHSTNTKYLRRWRAAVVDSDHFQIKRVYRHRNNEFKKQAKSEKLYNIGLLMEELKKIATNNNSAVAT